MCDRKSYRRDCNTVVIINLISIGDMFAKSLAKTLKRVWASVKRKP